jgi:hypothetical protein
MHNPLFTGTGALARFYENTRKSRRGNAHFLLRFFLLLHEYLNDLLLRLDLRLDPDNTW